MEREFSSLNTLSPYCLIDLSIRQSSFGESIDAFEHALGEYLGSDRTRVTIDAVSFEGALEKRRAILNVISELFWDGWYEEFFECYALALRCLDSTFVDSDERDLKFLLGSFIESVSGGAEFDAIALRNGDDYFQYYEMLARYEGRNLGWDALVLSPLIYWTYLPFWPISHVDVLFSRLRASIGSTEPIGLQELVALLSRKGVHCTSDFLEVWARNDSTLLVGQNCGHWVCAPMQSVLPAFPLIRAATARSDLVSETTRYFPYMGEHKPIAELTRLRICETTVSNLFCTITGGGIDRQMIDWDDVGAKLLLSKDWRLEDTVQDIPQSLHAAIVDALLGSGSAMSRAQLERAVGVRLELSPEMLGPGRIMAWARHPRFLNPEDAFYVLSDWVETPTERRGRIPADRIVTPFISKDISFDLGYALKIASNDPLFSNYKIVVAEDIADRIARALPSLPIELYYVTKIKENIYNVLKPAFVDIGRGALVTRTLFGGCEIDDEMSGAEIRRKVLEKALDVSEGEIFEAIERINDEGVRNRLRHICI